MKINKPNFGIKKSNFFSLMLLPFSYIYFLIITIKKYFKKKKNSLFQLYVLVIFMLAVLEKHPFVLS